MASRAPPIFRRLRNAQGLLVRDAPLVFRKHLPSGRPEARGLGFEVEVRIHPDLRICVVDVSAMGSDLTGRYSFGEVRWDQQPSPAFPATSLSMLAADVRDVLRLFRMREIDPRAWTSVADALAHL